MELKGAGNINEPTHTSESLAMLWNAGVELTMMEASGTNMSTGVLAICLILPVQLTTPGLPAQLWMRTANGFPGLTAMAKCWIRLKSAIIAPRAEGFYL